ncbi:MAG: alpha/beta hydrolase [Ilumatobacteraceae bacterium]
MSAPAPSTVLVVSEHGCREAGEGGDALAAALDRAGIEWRDVAPGALSLALGSTAGEASIAVLAIGPAADVAIDIVASDPRVAIVVVAGALLGDESTHLLGAWKDVPIVVVADATVPETLEPAARLYRSAAHPDSDLEIVSTVEIAGESFCGDGWDDVAQRTVHRIRRALSAVGARRDVVVTTSDGWQIHGTLTVPERARPVPAAILLHSGRSDRAVFVRLVGLLTRLGIATLNIDWRGRGLSQNLTTYFELSPEARAEGWRDAAAAVEFLESVPGVDADRIAMIGVVHGAEHAVVASIDEPRVRMLALLTGYVPRDERERAHLVRGEVEVWYVSCDGHGPVTGAMRALVDATPPGRAMLRVYPGGAIGYQLFDIDPRLEDELARWVAGGLGADAEPSLQATGSGTPA